jgi:chaperonin GroES
VPGGTRPNRRQGTPCERQCPFFFRTAFRPAFRKRADLQRCPLEKARVRPYNQHSQAASANNGIVAAYTDSFIRIVEPNRMKLRPLHDRVIIKRLDNERKTASGIVIPDNVAEKPDQGEILAVGNGKVGDDGKVRPLAVKVGDKVLFGKYSGQTVKVEGEELLVMREEDIMAVVE